MKLMKRSCVAILAVLVVLSGSVVPSDAWSRGGGKFGGSGGFRGGGHSHGGGHIRGGGHSHGGGHFRGGLHRGGWWGPGALIGGLALGAALAYPYYAYPEPVYVPPVVAEPPPVVYQQPAVQREVVYSHGKYVLYGDGVRQPWQWVWVPAPPPPAPQ